MQARPKFTSNERVSPARIRALVTALTAFSCCDIDRRNGPIAM
jgi:hypothetical protein